ncbi:hypothetical protein, partial [uncultured Duncaniella sp.]|uniref:hypothetical protein n=1 Tax=uncultured Duncaniella sp. TaxID=2768039 RepID=UPI00260574E1
YGELLYLDEAGEETIEQTDTPKMVSAAKITYSAATAENVKTPEQAYNAIRMQMGSVENSYLLWVITDNGRGVSQKRIRILPNYRLSRGTNFLLYSLSIMENGSESESFYFNPLSIINNNVNISMQAKTATSSKQVKCVEDQSAIEAFIAKIAEFSDMTVDTVKSIDMIFGFSKKGEQLQNIIIDDNGLTLNNSFGQAMPSGTNGAFGDRPIAEECKEEYIKQAKEALDGTYDTVIFNLDQYKIDAFIDANYPDEIKKAIETLVAFREDCMFFRDIGLGNNTLDDILFAAYDALDSKFVSVYCPTYDVIDPYSKKQITVTIGYSLAKLLTDQFNNGRNLPIAGIKFNMIIKDAIYGTLNFAPTVCPDPIGNQKTVLEEARINFASYIDGDLVIETLYTNQSAYTQFSFANNVLGIQEVVKAIRTRCPAIRYTFIDGKDLEKYKAEIEEVIAPFRSNFKALQFEYVADAAMELNKIFYGVLKVVFRDFIQTEWFKVIALNSIEGVV